MRNLLIAVLLPLVMSACSEGTNINQLFVNKEQKEAADYSYERAQYFFDRGEYDKAKKHAENVYNFNKENEEAGVLLSYIYLGLARVDIFDLADNLIDQSDEEDETPAQDKSAVASLDSLSGVIGLEGEDRRAMADDDNVIVVDGSQIKGVSDNPLFAGLDVTLPKNASDSRTANSKLLTNLNNAIKTICPFVNDEAKIITSATRAEEDARHSRTNCEPSSGPRRLGAKTHFIWAFSHLTEAIAFNSLMSELIGVLNKRGNAIGENNGAATVNAQQYVDGLVEIVGLVNAMLPTDPARSTDSMLVTVFNDMEAASLGFGQIDGIPEDLTKSINQGLAKLKSSSQTIGENGNAAALKDQLLGGLTTKIREEMTKRDAQFSPQQKTKACSAYKSITTQKFPLCA